MVKHYIETPIDIGQIVYFRCDEDNQEWICIAFVAYSDHIKYLLACEGEETIAHKDEILTTKRIPGIEYN